ncbi:hypothetical protein [Streptomyces sp. NPDC001933]
MNLHHIDGPDIFGPRGAGPLLGPEGLDRLHPWPAGHPVLAGRFLAAPT